VGRGLACFDGVLAEWGDQSFEGTKLTKIKLTKGGLLVRAKDVGIVAAPVAASSQQGCRRPGVVPVWCILFVCERECWRGVWDLKHRSKMVGFEARKRGSVNENKEESEQKRGQTLGANPVVALDQHGMPHRHPQTRTGTAFV